MSDYTPSTGDVRKGWIGALTGPFAEYAGQSFDNWLAAHDRQIAAAAWAEGYADAQHDEHEHRPGRKATNPYKEQQ